MCGISTIVHKLNQTINPDAIRAMNDKIVHRGPDGEGYFFGSNFAFGHRRLAILDLSQSANQPMHYGPNDRYTLIYNGELYNYIEIRNELTQKGYTFKSQSDTEVILASFDHWKHDCVKHFKGMWAFVIYNKHTNELFCSRDRFGIKPLYYTHTSGHFLMASEIKQFFAHDEFFPTLNKQIALNFIVNADLNTSRETFFEGVYELRGGQNLIYNLGNHEAKIETWYTLDHLHTKPEMTFETAKDTFRTLLVESVRMHFRSDVGVGTCLSGGLDSSVITSIAHKDVLTDNRQTMWTVSSCYHDKQYDEQHYIDQMTTQTGFKSEKIFPDFEELIEQGVLDKMIYHQDQPFGSLSHFSEYKVFETAAKNQLTVMLDGQGADEYLAGYWEFFIVHCKELLRTLRFKALFKEIKYRSLLNGVNVGFGWREFINVAIFNGIRVLVKKTLGYKTNISKCCINPNYHPLLDEKLSSEQHIKFKNILDLSKFELSVSSLPYQLHSEDRNAMLHAVESRLPFLDHELVEFALAIPDNFKMNGGIKKYILRQAFADYLPKEILNRHQKMGFVAPDELFARQYQHYFRTELNDAIENSKGLLNTKIIAHFDAFIEGKQHFDPLFFRILAFGRFLKIFRPTLKP